jgi:hypothetical protein
MDWIGDPSLTRAEKLARFEALLDAAHPIRRWQIELPFTKPANLNARQHHMVRAKVVAEHREDAREVISLAKIPPMDHIVTRLFYAPVSNARRDPINLTPTLKVLEDAVVDCGIVPDDNPLYVRSEMPIILPKSGERRGFLWLVIEEA